MVASCETAPGQRMHGEAAVARTLSCRLCHRVSALALTRLDRMAALRLPRLSPGSPYPLGATWDGLGTNFAVFSAHAERIDLCLFDPSGRREIARYTLPEYTDEVWHGYLPRRRRPACFTVTVPIGPYDPHERLPLQSLTSCCSIPMRGGLAGHLRWSDALYGYRVNFTARRSLVRPARQRARRCSKRVVTDEAFNWGDDRPPAVPWSDTVIYEAHVRGLTMLRKDIRPNERGTFAALGASGK